MAIRKARQGKKRVEKKQVDTYYFDVEIYKRCPMKDDCYKEGTTSKSYNVTVKSDDHSEQMVFQDSDTFK